MKQKFCLIFFLGIFLVSGCHAAGRDGEENPSKETNAKYHVIGSSNNASESFGAALNTPDEVWNLVQRGGIAYDQKRYDQAIELFEKALKTPGLSRTTEWISRGALSEAYEAKGQYALAIPEIDWQIAQGSRQEVIEELNARKQNLEKLLAK